MGINAAPGWMPGPRHYEEVELWIKGTFLEALFEPLMKALRSAWTRNRLRFQNSAIDEEALLRAIERGDIVLTKNRIKGKMSSVIVRGLRAFGAKRYGETWEFKNVPEEVLLASSNYRKLKIQAAELARKAMEMFEAAAVRYPDSPRWHIFYAGPAPGGVVVGQQLNPTMIREAQLYEFQRPRHIPSITITPHDSSLTRWTVTDDSGSAWTSKSS